MSLHRARKAPAELELPEHVQITPSQPNSWRAGKPAGARFTAYQLRAMDRLGYDPDKIETVVVRSTATIREHYWPEGDPAPVYLITCPIIDRRRDGRLKVISPAGDNKLVWSDGRITRRGM